MARPQEKPIRVVLIEDHAAFRAGLRMLIENRHRLKVAGEAGNRAEALTVAAREQPDIILFAPEAGGESGIKFISELRAAAKRTAILVLADSDDPKMHQLAMRLGAAGLVPKRKSVEVLFKAMETVYAGQTWLDRSMTAKVFAPIDHESEGETANLEAAKIATLTVRERQVVTLVGQGLKNKLIAERLLISEATVRHHLTSIFDKLDVSDRFELTFYAFRHGLALPPAE